MMGHGVRVEARKQNAPGPTFVGKCHRVHAARAYLHYRHLTGAVLTGVGGDRGTSSGGKVLWCFERAVAHLRCGAEGV